MADACTCTGCKDRRFFLKRAEEFRRMAEASECVEDAARRIAKPLFVSADEMDEHGDQEGDE